jgi:hypothetical protein
LFLLPLSGFFFVGYLYLSIIYDIINLVFRIFFFEVNSIYTARERIHSLIAKVASRLAPPSLTEREKGEGRWRGSYASPGGCP